MTILNTLKKRILVGDGAMGTLLYAEGLDTCPEHYNLTHPDKVEAIHRLYVEAGADVIQTNTYGANFEKLKAYGLEHRVKEIHQSAVAIAKRAAGPDTFVVGTVGGFRGIKKLELSLSAILYHTSFQIDTLVQEGVDAILFETYYDVEELLAVVEYARSFKIPIIAQLTAQDTCFLKDGTVIQDALIRLEATGADIIGLNCHHGPHHMNQTYKHLALPEHAFLSCYPNASLLDIEDNMLKYSDNAVYFSQVTRELVREGVRLIGGCCGTTPSHIRRIKDATADLKPATSKNVIPFHREAESVIQKKEPSLKELVEQRPTIIVELDTPKHLDTGQFFRGIEALEKAQVDAVTLADNSLACVRMCNITAASIIKQRYKIRPLVHIACRDKNIIGLQSSLMGLAALGINDVLAVTGDPSKVGNFPGATSVFDVNSHGLAEIIRQFNRGISADGSSLRKRTTFTVAGAFNANVSKLPASVQRLQKKQKAGVDYFITQPIYDKNKIKEIYDSASQLDTSIFIGIMPITSYKNALFLHNEVPGIKLSEELIEAFRLVEDDRVKTQELSLEICQELIDETLKYFNGIYLVTPFLKYELTVELAEYAQRLTKK
ncbi:bifunctional homocysteine S-methyltransferase/methylenetetrahydrofolate reductase [Macrococcus brunensis]|uniref:bifunctional homocysteine S-methyltransferase/methylenetetrahydrofolate reductase n=1 Tax=Macrococcus brunensis TaxID=198483 RepID=UPI001EF048AA|nr:bifunctional homocysteine S-methyltransferase/methylenetetrahydrofolate reductase [Macrococcus brunensis]ULG74472.1 bifunctional homocysteine S-methyltransferase/methylenetetrahydrofolate reductase [Macrococcus brunensis]